MKSRDPTDQSEKSRIHWQLCVLPTLLTYYGRHYAERMAGKLQEVFFLTQMTMFEIFGRAGQS